MTSAPSRVNIKWLAPIKFDQIIKFAEVEILLLVSCEDRLAVFQPVDKLHRRRSGSVAVWATWQTHLWGHIMQNPLQVLWRGLPAGNGEMVVPWFLTKDEFIDVLPSDSVDFRFEDWPETRFTIFGITRSFFVNFQTHPFFHEIRFTVEKNRALFEFSECRGALIEALGQPPSYRSNDARRRWHDRQIVLDIALLTKDKRALIPPDLEQCGDFFFEFRLVNSSRLPEHWNNQDYRSRGLEVQSD